MPASGQPGGDKATLFFVEGCGDRSYNSGKSVNWGDYFEQHNPQARRSPQTQNSHPRSLPLDALCRMLCKCVAAQGGCASPCLTVHTIRRSRGSWTTSCTRATTTRSSSPRTCTRRR